LSQTLHLYGFPPWFFSWKDSTCFFLKRLLLKTVSQTFWIVTSRFTSKSGSSTWSPLFASDSYNGRMIAWLQSIMESLLMSKSTSSQDKPRFSGKPKMLLRSSNIFRDSDLSMQWISPSYKNLTRWSKISFVQGQIISIVIQQCSFTLCRMSLMNLVWPKTSLWIFISAPSCEYRMQSFGFFLRKDSKFFSIEAVWFILITVYVVTSIIYRRRIP